MRALRPRPAPREARRGRARRHDPLRSASRGVYRAAALVTGEAGQEAAAGGGAGLGARREPLREREIELHELRRGGAQPLLVADVQPVGKALADRLYISYEQ